MTRENQGELHDRNGSHIDALLRESAEHIPDDGFTDRLMAQLPPPRRASQWRWLILTLFGVLGGAAGLYGLWGVNQIPTGARASELLWHAMTWSPPTLPMALPVLPFLLAAGSLAGALAYSRR